MVKSKQTRRFLLRKESSINPLTEKPFGDNYLFLKERVDSLPANDPALKKKLFDLLDKHQLIVLSGETGSGKSTQTGKHLLEYLNYKGKVVVTQPRTLNAQSIAQRVSEELDVTLGEEVGYHYKFNKMVSSQTKLAYVTDGLLLNQTIRDPTFGEYTGIIIDEAHERNVYIDFLLLYIKRLILSKKRPEMRFIIMSATLELDKFMDYFKGISVGFHSIPGRTFPVEKVFLPKTPADDYYPDILATIKNIYKESKEGDIVIFLTAKSEIDKMKKMLNQDLAKEKPAIFGLYRGVPEEEKKYATDGTSYKKMKGNPNRKIVLTTNIAETGVTIDGVVFVIDPGRSLQMSYDPVKRMNILKNDFITKASAKQRAGRAGRTRPGKCYYLYSEKDFNAFKEAKEPDIRITNIDSLLLNLSSQESIPDITKFLGELIEPPSKQQIDSSMNYLQTMELLDNKNKITPGGVCVVSTGLEIPLGIFFLASKAYQVDSEAIKIIGMLASEDNIQKWFIPPPREDHKKTKTFRKTKEKYYNTRGDIFAMYKIYQDYLEHSRKWDWLRKKFISVDAMRTAEKVMSQLNSKVVDPECIPKRTAPKEEQLYANITNAYTHGYYYNLAAKEKESSNYKIIANKETVSIEAGDNNFLDKVAKLVIFMEYTMIDDSPTLSGLLNIFEPKIIESIAPHYYTKVFKGGKAKKKSSPKKKNKSPKKVSSIKKKSPKKVSGGKKKSAKKVSGEKKKSPKKVSSIKKKSPKKVSGGKKKSPKKVSSEKKKKSAKKVSSEKKKKSAKKLSDRKKKSAKK
jgi:pre-mRNA-splicing factor ATP-dependent RNA helicase DHX15/PRP43